MDGNKTVTATFTQNQYTLTVTPAANGTVALDPPTGPYNSGTTVQLTATAAPGWTFAGWGGDLSGSTNPTSILMDGDKTVTAAFTASQYTFGVSASPVSGGTVGQSPGPPYAYGAVVTLTATPAAGYTFTGWSGDLGGSLNPAQITIDGNKSVTANFAINTYTLTYTAGANGSISGTSPQTVNYGASGTAVTAEPAVGYSLCAVERRFNSQPADR